MIDYDRDGEGKMRKRNAASGGFLRKTYHQLLHVTNHCRNFAPLQPTQQLGEGRRTKNKHRNSHIFIYRATFAIVTFRIIDKYGIKARHQRL